MKKFFNKLGLKLRQFMVGRYGVDSLWGLLLILYLVVIIIANIVYRFSKISYWALIAMSLVLLIYALFRAFSKNISARREENEKWLTVQNKIKAFFSLQKSKFQQRKTHKFVKCKSCKKVLRLPRRKGKIKVTCPHCGAQFTVNTGKKQTAASKSAKGA